MLHQDLTQKILSACFDVAGELGHGFLEGVYERALVIALEEVGLSAESQVPLKVHFRGQPVGDYYADILVEQKVLVELKAVSALLPEHQAQVINYLRATNVDVGLLVNFGRPRIEYKRLFKPSTQA